MPAKRDYYETLEVPRDASPEAIKKAYRRLALKYHPDRNAGKADAEQMFKAVSEAYEVLSDPQKRQQYDRFGHEGLKSSFGPGGFNFSRDFTHMGDIQDIFGEIFGGGGFFDDLFGRSSGRSSARASARPARGSDLRLDLEIEFEESVFGSEREITLPVSEECGRCKGSGSEPGHKKETCKQCDGHGAVITSSGFFRVQQECPVCGGKGEIVVHPCRKCRGTGFVKDVKRLSIRIPPGVETGSRLRLAGKGEGGIRGGPAGDLYLVLHVKPHPLFHRQGDDLFCEIFIPLGTAILGGEVSVPTIEGPAKIKVSPGTESGKVFRLRGKGMPGIERHGRGNLHVRLITEIPKNLSSTQKKSLKAFLDACRNGNYPETAESAKRARNFYARRKH